MGRTRGEPVDVERARAARDREAAHADVRREIFSEMGSALARANEKVDLAMDQLTTRAQALAAARARFPHEAHADLVVAFNAQRERARVALWELRVHREALGIRDHRAVDAAWTLPPVERA